MSAPLEITRFAKSGGPLTKRIHLDANGKVVGDGSACIMSSGAAHRAVLHDLQHLARLIDQLKGHEAIALGALRHGIPDQAEVTTKRRLNGHARPDLIARTADHISYRRDRRAIALLDYDTKGMPASVAARLQELGGYWPALMTVCNGLGTAARVTRSSTSSGLFNVESGERLPGSSGVHVYVEVKDGADIERFLRTLHDRCWLAGLGWMMIGAGGQFLERSIVDRMVGAPERLVFEGAPVLEAPLAQDAESRRPAFMPGIAIDTLAACPVLTLVETATLHELRRKERGRLAGASAAARAAFIEHQTKRLIERTGVARAAAAKVIARQCAGILRPDVILPFDDQELSDTTVADVLANAEGYEGATLADPLEGAEYGVCKAKVMRRADGSPWIHSFAHGRTVYELTYDARAIRAALEKAAAAEAADVFTRLMLVADVDDDEAEELRNLASARSGVGNRALDRKLKSARQEHRARRAEEDRNRRALERTDLRLQLECPLPDAERLPVITAIDEVFCGIKANEPPIRDLEGHPVEVRTRAPLMLHLLTSAGANGAEAEETRLAPPALPLLTRHDKFSLAHLVERHIEYLAGERAVALPPAFIDHYSAYRDSRLPRVGAVVTMPLVLPGGTLLAPKGLDRDRKLVFRIDPVLSALLPKPADCTPHAAAEALRYLAGDWLADVATDFTGKCILLSAALTMLERVLLAERPAFFITAGQRGGGKTTAATMLILAITGQRPPAAAWSPGEEERRKAMLSYLSEGLTALVWDNIPRGASISCPSIEKTLTAETYSDRVLGQTGIATVPTFTVQMFTGNNIAPRGDMSSRSLTARLTVDRPDPENRSFHHPDPIAWTVANRGAILRALYTILLGNAQLQPDHARECKTRFKTWWRMVGSAIENAAEALAAQDEWLPADDPAKAIPIDFTEIFAAGETEDEQTSGLAIILDILHSEWRERPFVGGDVARFINNPLAPDAAKATTLKQCIEQANGNEMPVVTPTVVGFRLKAVVDAPVRVGEQTMTLRRTPQAGNRSARFWVKLS